MSRISATTAAAVIGISLLVQPAFAQPAPSGPAMDTPALLARVKQRYVELDALPVRVVQTFQATSRTAGNPDVTTTGTLVSYQQRDIERSVMLNATLHRPAVPGVSAAYTGPAFSRLEWLHNQDGIRILTQPAPSQPGVVPPITSTEVRSSELDPQLRVLVNDTLATLQTLDQVAAKGAVLRRQFRNGVEKHLIRTRDPVELAPGILADIELWVGRTSFLVERMAAVFEIRTPGQPDPVFIDFLTDLSYDIDVAIPAGYFTLPTAEQLAATPPAAAPQGRMTAPPAAAPGVQNTTPEVKGARDFLLKNYKP